MIRNFHLGKNRLIELELFCKTGKCWYDANDKNFPDKIRCYDASIFANAFQEINIRFVQSNFYQLVLYLQETDHIGCPINIGSR
jgi:hypothetical protein